MRAHRTYFVVGCHWTCVAVLKGAALLVSIPPLRTRHGSLTNTYPLVVCETLIFQWAAPYSPSPSALSFFFLIGALCPLTVYLISRRWPNNFLKLVNFPVIFSGTGAIPPATAVNYVPWTIVGFTFQYLIRRRHFSWWTKYNCGCLRRGFFL